MPVRRRSGTTVELGADAVCDLSQGSRWAIHAAGTKAVAPGGAPLGVLVLTAVRAVTSEGRLVQGAGREAIFHERDRAVLRVVQVSIPRQSRGL